MRHEYRTEFLHAHDLTCLLLQKLFADPCYATYNHPSVSSYLNGVHMDLSNAKSVIFCQTLVVSLLIGVSLVGAESENKTLTNRAYTDPLIVITHNGAVAERQYSGFFAGNKPEDVYMRGDLRLARNYFGKQDVFCLHPWSQTQPTTADFSKITGQASGTLILNLHNLFDPKTKQAGDCKAILRADDNEIGSTIVEGNDWTQLVIPFNHNRIHVEIAATGWFWEHAFVTYEVILDSKGVQATATRSPNVGRSDVAKEIARLTSERDSKIAVITTQLNEARAQLTTSTTSAAKRAAESRISTLAAEKMNVKSEADKAIAALTPSPISEPQKTVSVRKRANGREWDLQKPGPNSKFPDWNGPWRTCGVCDGKGHSYASQRQTMQDVSPMIGQIAGTGMSGSIRNAVSYCESCGGTGSVPAH